jgi:peptidoglycan hydrolase-like protein with peptidoglycan-binding domain
VPAVEPAALPPPVHTSLPVRDVQTLLNTLGASLKPDNLFGPKTASAWRRAALARDLPAHIVRMAPQVVQVTTYTLDRLRAASGGVAGLYIP